MQIIPAILEVDARAVANKLALVQADGNFNLVQIDIIDGALLPNLTVTPFDLIHLDFTNLQLDFHLMTEDPLDYVWEIAAQKNLLPVHGVFGQVERMSDQTAFLTALRQQHYQAGLALDLTTPLDSLDQNIFPLLDAVLLLAVPMGAQGQTFQPQVYQKITDLTVLARENHRPNLKIYLDGGIKAEHLTSLAAFNLAGVAIGSYFWQTHS